MKNLKFAKLGALILTSAFNFSAVAAEQKAPGSGPNPFVDCGIGAALFPNTHWAAVSSNVIWDIGTTAVTSATASPETCSGKNVETAKFIIDNYDNLAQETAKGNGEHLTALMGIMQCQEGVQSLTIESMRQSMAPLVGNENYTNQNLVEKASDYYHIANTAAQQSCSA